MGNDLFSSPSKQAGQAATAVGNIDQGLLTNLEQYDQQQKEQARSAISGMGGAANNPFLQQANSMNTAAYQVNPNATTSFGASGPGLTQGQASIGQSLPPNVFQQQQTPPLPPPQSTQQPPPTGIIGGPPGERSGPTVPGRIGYPIKERL